MYGKIFEQMYEGTLASRGPWEALVTFQQLIVLANRHGEVDMTPEAISRRTTIPLEIIQKGLAILEQPDPDSRTPDQDGRRITRLDEHRSWGWRLVNYEKYRKIRSEEERREYQANWIASKRANAKGRMSTVVDNVDPCSKQYAVSSKHKTSRPSDDVNPTGSPEDALAPSAPGVSEQLYAFWNENRGPLPEVLKLTKGRRDKIARRIKADPQFPDLFRRAVLKARETPFCAGAGSRGWKVSFSWLIENDSNSLAVIEGKYDGNGAVSPEAFPTPNGPKLLTASDMRPARRVM